MHLDRDPIHVSFPYDLSEYQPEDSELVFAKWYDELVAEEMAEEMGVQFKTC